MNVVLQRDGNAVQRTSYVSPRPLAIECLGFRQGPGIDREHGV